MRQHRAAVMAAAALEQQIHLNANAALAAAHLTGHATRLVTFVLPAPSRAIQRIATPLAAAAVEPELEPEPDWEPEPEPELDLTEKDLARIQKSQEWEYEAARAKARVQADRKAFTLGQAVFDQVDTDGSVRIYTPY